MGETQTVARHIVGLTYEKIPPKNLDDMKVLLLDYLGVALGGARTQSGKIAADFCRDLGEKGEATIIGFGYRVSALSAAFSNAISSHSLELDDTDSLALFHFSPPVFSAALAVAEREGASGRAFLTAALAGCELMARLCQATNSSLRERGFHITPACGVFGAAAASGKILGLDEPQLTSALGLAGAQASGLMEFYGVSMQKRFNPAAAARGGVVAALLAGRGFTGAETILEGPRGFCRAFSNKTDLSKLTFNLGKEFPIYIEYKPYACARPIHNAIDCALEIRSQHDLKMEDIEEIAVRRHPQWASYHIIHQPRTYHEAQVSLPYSVAVALVEGKAFLEQYAEESLKQRRVLELARKVVVTPDEALARGVSCEMTIRMKDGTRYHSRVDYPRGSLENPMTERERIEKFQSLAGAVIGQEKRRQVVAMVGRLEEVEDISPLFKLLY